jgi:hypothetical protein
LAAVQQEKATVTMSTPPQTMDYVCANSPLGCLIVCAEIQSGMIGMMMMLMTLVGDVAFDADPRLVFVPSVQTAKGLSPGISFLC